MAARPTDTRLALVGAGFIADVHLRALARRRDVRVVAVVDPAERRARRLADRFGIAKVFASLDELLDAGVADAAHVLVPPELHVEVAQRCLEAGLHTLVEKPMALSAAEVKSLGSLAEARSLCLGVNHNFTWFPVFRRLKADQAKARLGRLQHVSILHNLPLRQLETGDVDHFMFQSEANILLEQGVHHFSLVESLLGRCRSLQATAGPVRGLANGAPFRDTWSMHLVCQRGTAQITMNVGREFPSIVVDAIGTDGAVRLDFVRSTYQRVRKTRWLEFYDNAHGAMFGALPSVGQGLRAIVDYGLALFGLSGPADAFARSMAGSIRDFHDALRERRRPECDATQAERVAEMCEMAASSSGVSTAPWQAPPLAEPGPARAGEIVITGGTGFVGRHLVPKLLDQGHPVTLLVRRPQILPERLRDSRLRVVVGDATDAEAVDRAVPGARCVLHMATCAGSDAEETQARMTGGVRVLGEACLRHGVARLVFVSSTAALYLGGGGTVRGSGGPDQRPEKRPAYSRGKIAAERAVAELAAERGLETVVVRPAIVVGEGGLAEHSGVGLWVRDNHCVGWGTGRVRLPLVLAGDVAEALIGCVSAPGIGGRSFNLAGPVQLTGREYVAELRAATGRDHHYHPQPLLVTFLIELGKWLIKKAARRPADWLSMRDLRSRAFLTRLDCSDAEQDLGWQPEADRQRFVAAAIAVHAPRADVAP